METEQTEKKRAENVKGHNWNEYQRKYSFVMLNKKLSSEALSQKIENMKQKTLQLERILAERVKIEQETALVTQEKEQLKMLMEKYGVVKSPETY
jgi:tRNA nucleotidyltransferase/poly(A) polymerase